MRFFCVKCGAELVAETDTRKAATVTAAERQEKFSALHCFLCGSEYEIERLEGNRYVLYFTMEGEC